MGLVRLEEEEAAVMINRVAVGREELRGAQPAKPPHTPQSVTPPPLPQRRSGLCAGWKEGPEGMGKEYMLSCAVVHTEKNKELIVLLRKTNRENYMKPHGALKK